MPDGSELSHRLDGVTVLGSAVFLGETTMAGARASGDGGWSVAAFGAVGDGVTDDSLAFQRALNATSTTAPRLVVPAGSYKITTGLTCSTANLELVGTGGPAQDGVVGNGATIILVGTGIVGFTFNPAASSTIFRGPTLRNLMFKDNAAGAATGGVLINRSNNWLLQNVVAAGFTGASSYGIKSDGTGNVSQYGTLLNSGANTCKVGLDLVLTNGLRVIGGMFDGNSNAGTVATGTTGIRHQSGDSLKITNTVIQFYATGVDMQGTGTTNASLIGNRFEGMTTHVSVAGDFNVFMGNTHSNNIIGGTGTVYSLAATADRNIVWGNHATAVTTVVANSGTNTVYTDFTGTYPVISVPDAASVRWAAGNLLTSGTNTPEGAVTAPVGSLFLRTNGGANTTLYIKESGVAATGWVAK
jgi:hypothetical protein